MRQLCHLSQLGQLRWLCQFDLLGQMRQLCDLSRSGQMRQVCDLSWLGQMRQLCHLIGWGQMRQLCDLIRLAQMRWLCEFSFLGQMRHSVIWGASWGQWIFTGISRRVGEEYGYFLPQIQTKKFLYWGWTHSTSPPPPLLKYKIMSGTQLSVFQAVDL